MLKNNDAALVAKWLREQIDAYKARHPGAPTTKELAALAGTSPQAVSGWIKTGRISKTNMAHVCRYFNAQPLFLKAGANEVQEISISYKVKSERWPFDVLDLDAVNALSKADLLRLEGAFLLTASQLGFDLRKRAAA